MHRCPGRPTTRGFGRARSSEPPAASVISRRTGKEDAPLPPLPRGNAREDVLVVVPGDIDCIVTVVALRRGGLGGARSSEPRRYWPPLGAREKKTLLYHLGRRNARVDVTVVSGRAPGDSDIIVTVAALRRHGLKRARSSEPPAASVMSRRVGSDRRSSTASDTGMLALMFLL